MPCIYNNYIPIILKYESSDNSMILVYFESLVNNIIITINRIIDMIDYVTFKL